MAETSKKPMAYRDVYRDSSGNLQLIFRDLQTGQPLPAGAEGNYQIYDSYDAAVDYMGAEVEKEEAEHAKSGSKTPFNREAAINRQLNGHKDPNLSGDYKAGRYPGNNYEYINRPGIMSLVSMVPGPIGTVGKLANAAIGANNVAAVNTARERLGWGTLGLKGSAKGILSDQKGVVGRAVAPNGQNYTVGLEAQDKLGRTTLTPDEAAKRGIYGPESEVDFKTDNDARSTKKQGLIGKALSGVGSLVNKVTGQTLDPTPTDTPTVSPVNQTVGGFLSSVKEGNIIGKLTGIDFDKEDAPRVSPSDSIEGVTPTSVDSLSGAEIAEAAEPDYSQEGAFGGLAQPGNYHNEDYSSRVSYAGVGTGRPHHVAKEHEDFVGKMARDYFGPTAEVNVTSGDIDPGDPAWGGKLSSSRRHNHQFGTDMGVTYKDPVTGQTLQADAKTMPGFLSYVASQNAQAGIGYNKNPGGYMGPTVAHIDQAAQYNPDDQKPKKGQYNWRQDPVTTAEVAYGRLGNAVPPQVAPVPDQKVAQNAGFFTRPTDFDQTPGEEASFARNYVQKTMDNVMAQASQNIANSVQRGPMGVPVTKVQTTKFTPPSIATTALKPATMAPTNNFTMTAKQMNTLAPPTSVPTTSYTPSAPMGTPTKAQSVAPTSKPGSNMGFTGDSPSFSARAAEATASTPSQSSVGSTKSSASTSRSSNSSAGSSSNSSGGYSGKSGSGFTGGSGRSTSMSDSTGGNSGGGSGRSSSGGGLGIGGGGTHSSEHERDSSLGGGGSKSSSSSSGAGKGHSSTPGGAGGHSGSKNDRGGFAGL